MSHTPEPWKASAEGIAYPNTRKIILAFKDGVEMGNAVDDCRLIDAAPVMLSALVRLKHAADCRESTMGDPCRLIAVQAELREAAKQADAAIRMAREGLLQ